MTDRTEFVVPEIPFRAGETMAGRHDGADALAPMIFDCWDVIARAEEADRTLRTIKVLGEPLV